MGTVQNAARANRSETAHRVEMETVQTAARAKISEIAHHAVMATVQTAAHAKISEIAHHAVMATVQTAAHAKILEIGHRVVMAIVQTAAHAEISEIAHRVEMAIVQTAVHAKISEIAHHVEMATVQIADRAKISEIAHHVEMATVQTAARANRSEIAHHAVMATVQTAAHAKILEIGHRVVMAIVQTVAHAKISETAHHAEMATAQTAARANRSEIAHHAVMATVQTAAHAKILEIGHPVVMAIVQTAAHAEISEIGHHAEMATAQIGVRAKISEIGHRVGMAIVQIGVRAKILEIGHRVVMAIVQTAAHAKISEIAHRVEMETVQTAVRAKISRSPTASRWRPSRPRPAQRFRDRPPRRDGDRPDRGPRRDHDRGRPFSAPKGEGMDPARRYAIGQILRVIHDNKPLKDQSGAFWDGLEPRDQAFAERLIKSTLRQYGQMAKLVRRCLTAPKLDDERLEPVLATAACELVLLDTPPYAVGSRYVDLVRDWNEGRYKGLVNAVIRRLAEQGKTWFEALGPEAALPRWLVKRWQKNWGVEETSQWWSMFQEQSAVDLVVSPQASVDDTYALGLTAEPLATGQLRLAKDAGRVRDLPGFEAGAFWVQDVAAYMPATLFGDVEGQQIWDMCAAPGGKTMQLAAKGAKVTAIDVDGSRLKRLRENLARVGLTANVVEADILRWKPVSKPDAILLDAPCSATGTLRHHPDAPWLRDADWVVSNVQLQADMIDKALDLLPVGGTLVYAVCSLEPEEGEQQVEGVMQRRDDVRFDPIDADSFAYAQCVRGPGWMRVFPSDVMPRGADGFFAARLVKTAPGEGGGLEQWQAERADQTLAEDGAEGAQQPERARLSLKS